MEFQTSFYQEENRNGYLVSAQMKKVWAMELDLLERFDLVCRKYDLKYYAGFGTLLGAVRHQGFIPWDDDMDIWMMRKDYEQLKQVAGQEFQYPYFLQDWYNSNGMTWAFSKLRNGLTAAVEFPDKSSAFNQGIFIDIYPIDDAMDTINFGEGEKRIQREIFDCIMDPIKMLKGILAGQEFALDIGLIRQLCTDVMTAQKTFDSMALQLSGISSKVAFMVDEFLENGRVFDKADFDDVIYMPFEGFSLPVPAGYDHILTACYGEYMEPAQIPNNHQGHIILDPDRPYTDYLNNKNI